MGLESVQAGCSICDHGARGEALRPSADRQVFERPGRKPIIRDFLREYRSMYVRCCLASSCML